MLHTVMLKTITSELDAKIIGENLEFNKSLQILNLSHNQVGNAGAKALANALRKCRLRQLEIANARIYSEGIRLICASLFNNKYLQYLNINNNESNETGSSELGRMLKQNQSLKKIDMQYNHAGFGIKQIAQSLTVNKTLEYLNLHYNHIERSGAMLLFQSLKSNNSLIELNLCDNQIEDAGAEDLIRLLKSGCSIRNINLRLNNITQSLNEKLFKTIKDKAIHIELEDKIDYDMKKRCITT